MGRCIRSKREFYRLAAEGLCGNTMKTWCSLSEYWLVHKEHPFVGVRRLTPGKPGNYKIHYSKIREYLRTIPKNDYIISAIPGSEHKSSFQGELSWINGWYLYYSYKAGIQRYILPKYGKNAHGWRVICLLRYYLGDNEYDALMDLFNKYTVGGEYPVIEFAVLRDSKSTFISGFRTVIWEIRHY